VRTSTTLVVQKLQLRLFRSSRAAPGAASPSGFARSMRQKAN
jgi:hypothetical protein